MSVHLKVQAALWAADKACDVIEKIQASREEKASKISTNSLRSTVLMRFSRWLWFLVRRARQH